MINTELSHNETTDRYQFQNRFVKVCRWLRWKPWWAMLAVLGILGHPNVPIDESDWFPTRRSYYKHLWMCMSLAAAKMKYIWTMEEVMDELRRRDTKVC